MSDRERKERQLEWSKRIAVLLFLAINLINVVLAYTTNLPQIVCVLILVLSIVPYLIHLHMVSPRIM